jgi:hypothetical protein
VVVFFITEPLSINPAKTKPMKTLTAIVATAFLSMAAACAHEGHEHAAGGGLFGQPPEYVHILLNPVPAYGLGLGALALGAALVARSKPARAIALGIVLLGSASAWPVLHYGQNAYAGVRDRSDDAGQQWLDAHMSRAEKSVYAFYVTAALALAALAGMKKLPKAATPLTVVTLVAAVVSIGIGGWISRAGGQIRHPEFRATSDNSTNPAPHEHGGPQPSHEKMQPPRTGGEHKHGETSEPSAEKIPMPETFEGVWKAIHVYRGELESAVNARKFGEVQSGAKTIGALAKKLMALTSTDRKAVVESGVNRMDQSLDELRSSAETGSDSVMKMRFKEFDEGLNQLEQQATKQ